MNCTLKHKFIRSKFIPDKKTKKIRYKLVFLEIILRVKKAITIHIQSKEQS